MPSTSPTHVSDISGPSGNDAANLRDLWEQALISLSSEDQKQFGEPSSSMIDVLKGVHGATESKKKDCISKGWRLYRNKKGEKVKLRHVLEKISTWVKAMIKVVDVGVSADQSGHAALPWAIVKYLTMIGFSDIDEFSNVAEGIEVVASLIARYTIVEKLYLQQDCEAQEGLQEAITKLYAAVLIYLAKVKAYVSGNTLKRFGRSLIDMIRKQYDELRAKISELEVEKWTKLVDAEIQLASREDATADIRVLRDIMSGLNKPILQMSDQISMFQDKFDRDERIKVFRWMSTIEYRSHHDGLSKDVLAQSGRWLLDSQHFVDWAQSSVSSILWLHGIPGSGKTRLVSTVINSMLSEDPDPNTSPTAFVYCARSTAEPERAKPAEVMGALLRQLAGSKTNLPIKMPVAREYETRRRKAEQDCSMLKKLTVQDCTRLILELTKDQSATIILDALDECEEHTRHELLKAFDEIICNSAEVVKVLVSSRDDIDIKLHLENCKNISIGADNNSSDISRFVKSEVDRLVSERILLDGKVSPKIKRKIIETLTNGAQGMFRWVEMSLETLKRIKFLPDFKKALGQLPSELAGLYDIIYSQIERTEPYGQKVAIRTLNWLLCAQRLLSAEELIAAVYILDDDNSSDSDEDPEFKSETSPEDDILRLCRNFVIYDSEQDIFRFAHQSVREYLLKLSQYTTEELHAFAAERCLEIYLTKSLQDHITWQKDQQNAILESYAEIYWPVHYQYAENSTSVELKDTFLRFKNPIQGMRAPYLQWRSDILENCKSLSWEIELLTLERNMEDNLGDRIVFAAHHPNTLLGIASAFGLLSLLEAHQPSSKDLNEHLAKGHTLLSFAAGEGHNQVVRLLLDKGADANALKGLALRNASLQGHDHIVQTLLDHGADINASEGEEGTALHGACCNGHDSIVQLLLDCGADTNGLGFAGGNALNAACSYGHYSIVQLLLDYGADINFGGVSALQEASYGGHYSIVQLLLNHGANTNASGQEGTALQRACHEGHDSIVQLLLDHGADTNLNGGNALYSACYYGHHSIVQLLLDYGADINFGGGNALQEASFIGRYSIVQLLLNHGANTNASGRKGASALERACCKGHDSIVQLLLDYGADTNLNGGNALKEASYYNYDSIVQLLFDYGADINLGGGDALLSACYKGYDSITQLLLDHGADINTAVRGEQNALQGALEGRHDHIVQMLLDRGAGIDGVYKDILQQRCVLGHVSLPSRLKHLFDA